MNLLSSFKQKLIRSSRSFVKSLDQTLFAREKVDGKTLDDLEEILITGDLGIHTVTKLLKELTLEIKEKKIKKPLEIKESLKSKILSILKKGSEELLIKGTKPFVILVVGVNGSGKTTLIGKLAAKFNREGKKVILAAGDTFRAAAIEQLGIWAEKSGVEIIRQHTGSDPSAVIFDTLRAAKSRGADLVIADTAGRLHTRINLMEELKKNKRVIEKELQGMDSIHCEVLLVLDATLGQNILQQAKLFKEAVDVSGIALTKIDSTAKAGVIVNIIDTLKIPVRYLSAGEDLDDLRVFNPDEFTAALFGEDAN